MHKSGTYCSQNWNAYVTFVSACCRSLHITLCLVILFLFFKKNHFSQGKNFKLFSQGFHLEWQSLAKQCQRSSIFLSDWLVIMQGAKCYILTKMGEVRVDVCQHVTVLLLPKHIAFYLCFFLSSLQWNTGFQCVHFVLKCRLILWAPLNSSFSLGQTSLRSVSYIIPLTIFSDSLFSKQQPSPEWSRGA